MSSKRIDALITGRDHDDHPAAVLVEQAVGRRAPLTVPDCVGVTYGGRIRDQSHPSAQAGQYRQYLADSHTLFHDGVVRLDAYSYLHDFIHDPQSELLAPRHANLLGVYPLSRVTASTTSFSTSTTGSAAVAGYPSSTRSGTGGTDRTRSSSPTRRR